jgi:DNA topoisomerase-3
LTELYCRGNQITQLDIRPLRELRDLRYDVDSTRLIQRPDQNFSETNIEKAKGSVASLVGGQSLGNCPKCGARIFETKGAYICERSRADKRPCKFKFNKVVAQQPIEREQMQKLLGAGKTDLLEKFISKVGRRFSAYLVMDDAGRITFEFLSPG